MKDLLRYKGFWGSIEVSVDDKCIHGKLLFIDDIVTYEAESVVQLQEEFEAAVEDYLSTCKELGRDPNKPYSGSFNVRIGPYLHQRTARFAFMNNTSINDVVKQALVECLKEPASKEVIHKHFHIFEYRKIVDLDNDMEQVVEWKKDLTSNVVN